MTNHPRWHRMHAVDSAWYGIESVRVFRGVDLPPRADLTRAMDLMLDAMPRLMREFDPARSRWRAVPEQERAAWSQRLLEFTERDARSVEDAADLVREPLGPLPLRIVITDRCLVIRLSHGFCDGWSALTLLSHLLAQARTSDPVEVPWRTVSVAVRDATTFAVLVRRPRTLARAVRDRHSLRGGDVALQERPQLAAPFESVCHATGPGFTEQVRLWRDQHAPGASVATISLARLREAIAAHVGVPRPGAEYVFNVRGSSRAWRDAFGNWSSGVYLTAGNETAIEVKAAIAQAQHSALPVTPLAIARVKNLWHTRKIGARMVAAAIGSPRLTLSYIRAPQPLRAALGDVDDAQVATITTPNGPDTITLAVLELEGRMHITVSFYPSAWPRRSIEAAVAAFVGEFDAADATAESQMPSALVFAPDDDDLLRHQRTA